MMDEAEFRVCCVKQPGSSTSTQKAYDLLCENGFNPKWVEESDCMEMNTREKNCVYIFDPFEGDAFDHIVSLKFRVFGPPCVLSCLHLKVAIPRTTSPLYSLAMKDLVLNCTNIDRTLRDDLHEKIKLMSGEVHRDFTHHVTHLIAGEIGSKKYQVAGSLGKQIMLPEWVQEVWNESKIRHINGTDEEFLKWQCPIFHRLIITVSGLSADERKHAKSVVEAEGGQYSGEMKINECTHLVLHEAKGQKYEFAKKWNIHIVQSKWLYDSVEKGYCQNETDYHISSNDASPKPGLKTSTPERRSCISSRASVCELPDISCISNTSVISHINETAVPGRLRCNNTTTMIEPPDAITSFDMTNLNTDMFLDGCKIYLSGFGGDQLDKLRKIINVGGATRFNQINESISHVVMGERIDSDIKTLENSTHRPHVVSAEWLLECACQGKHVAEEPYISTQLAHQDRVSEPKVARESIIPTKCASVSDTTCSGEVSVIERKTDGDQEGNNPSAIMHDDMDLLSQYLPQQENEGDETVAPAPEPEPCDEDATQLPNEVTLADEDTGIFHGLILIMLGFDEEQVTELLPYIEEEGGRLVRPNTRAVPDYAVVPISGYPVEITVKEIVTNTWLQMCLETKQLLEISANELFQPINIAEGSTPLVECVLSISGFEGTERDCLTHIAEILGATVQEFFVRRANKDLQASTHLIVKTPSGSKYKAARKWGLPALDKSWLLASAKSGKHEPEDTFNIDDIFTPKIDMNHQSEDGPIVTGDDDDLMRPPAEESPSSGKENVAEVTPISSRPGHSRVKELQENRQSNSAMPQPRSPRTLALLGIDTPGKFLDPNKPFRPRFDMDDVMDALASPVLTPGQVKAHQRRNSIPLEEAFSRNLAQTIKYTEQLRPAVQQDGGNVMDTEMPLSQKQVTGPLHGIVIAVSKKLSPQQWNYNNIAAELGADYIWIYDYSCTHFIFQGRTNDSSKEFRLARADGKIIVSPYWLLACQEKNTRVEEAMFPHNYNPNKSLTVVESKITPARPTRKSMRANTQKKDGKDESCVSAPNNQTVNAASETLISTTAPPPVMRLELLSNVTADTHRPPAVNKLPVEQRGSSTDESVIENNVAENDRVPPVHSDHDHDVSESIPPVGTLDMREELSKQLENVLATSKQKKLSSHSRRKSRRLNLSGQMNVSGEGSSGDSVAGRTHSASHTRWHQENKSAPPGESHLTGSEPSQSVQITWDDPTGRMEQERLADQLQRAITPTQNSQHPSFGTDTFTENANFSELEAQALAKQPSEDKNVEAFRTPTPEAPAMGLCLGPTTDPETRRISLENERELENRPPPVFIVSGMQQQERDDYGALVENLGGRMVDGQIYSSECTHLVIGSVPTRNEKFLACVAAGKWVLHKSYFEACRQEGKFVQEEVHEWGSEGTQSILDKCTDQVVKLARAAHKWRQRTQEQHMVDPASGGAFNGWRVILCTDKHKEGNFRRLLEAGGAHMVATRPPFQNMTATHVFIDIHKVSFDQADLESLLDTGAQCMKPDYIAAYLTDNPPPPTENFCPAEIIALKAVMMPCVTTPKKRKSASSDASLKRSRKQ